MIADSTIYGASQSDWAHFSMVLGLTEDLLPVVSNPNAKISESSKMKELGKTPSQYIGMNGSRKVIGLPGWTAKITKDEEIDSWAQDPDLGICLQTRHVKVLDIDITDESQASAVEEVIRELLGVLPKRFRNNTSKSAFLLQIDGDMPKRKLVAEHGIIEFLATGQQMIVVGTHPSGVKYEWANGLPNEIPMITIDKFDACWNALLEIFAIEPETEGGELTQRKREKTFQAPDEVAAWLRTSNKVIGNDKTGALIIKCPWDHEHSSGSVGDGSTVWFPAGSNGYELGHFRCLHGHCDHRRDDAFIAEIGMPTMDEAEIFDVVVQTNASGESLELPPFARMRDGAIKATVTNLQMALRRFDITGLNIGYDKFRDQLMLNDGDGNWKAFDDTDYTRLRIQLEQQGFLPIGREMVRDSVLLAADDYQFDSAIDWLSTLNWDGVPRIETFNPIFLGSDDTPYTRAVGLYMWSAMAGRVMKPGVKADIVPIWQSSEQGQVKSSSILALVPDVNLFCEINFHMSEDNIARKLRGRLAIEIAELGGLNTKEIEQIKSFLSRQYEDWVPKYKEFTMQYARRCIFIGTTNETEILADKTGNRRFAPFAVEAVDRDAIIKYRDQLWAEGRDLFLASGVQYQGVEELMKDEHLKWMIRDAWEAIIRDWLNIEDSNTGDFPRDSEFIPTCKILREALGFMPSQINRSHEMRISKVMSALGYNHNRRLKNGWRERGWVKKGSLEDNTLVMVKVD